MENEVSFLLRFLNDHFPYGHVPDDNPTALQQGKIISRLLNNSLVTDFNRNQSRWYVHQNDGTGHWEN